MSSVFGSGELYFNILFLLAICSHDGFSEGIAFLLIIIHITGIKGDVSSIKSRAKINVNPRFLISVVSDCFGLYNIFYALPYEVRDSVKIDVVIGCSSENIPVNVIKTVL